MPDYARFQRSGQCTTCDGPIRFYPKPVPDPAADDPEGKQGSWVHLRARDWLNTPHVARPKENGA